MGNFCGLLHLFHDQRFQEVCILLNKNINSWIGANKNYLKCSTLIWQILHSFRTVVRVVTSYPWQAKDLRNPTTGNYRVRLTIEDSTARIHAYIFGDDGVRNSFFCSSHPASLVSFISGLISASLCVINV